MGSALLLLAKATLLTTAADIGTTAHAPHVRPGVQLTEAARCAGKELAQVKELAQARKGAQAHVYVRSAEKQLVVTPAFVW